MKGIYVIVEENSGIMYVGQSKQIEERVWQHYKIIQDEEEYDKTKMYWILGRMKEDPWMRLHCYILEEYSSLENVDLREKEKEWIKILKPVLNTQVPQGCIRYIDMVQNVVDAYVIATENKQYDINNIGGRKVW